MQIAAVVAAVAVAQTAVVAAAVGVIVNLDRTAHRPNQPSRRRSEAVRPRIAKAVTAVLNCRLIVQSPAEAGSEARNLAPRTTCHVTRQPR